MEKKTSFLFVEDEVSHFTVLYIYVYCDCKWNAFCVLLYDFCVGLHCYDTNKLKPVCTRRSHTHNSHMPNDGQKTILSPPSFPTTTGIK